MDDCRNLYKVYKDVDSMLEYIENYNPEDFDISQVKIRWPFWGRGPKGSSDPCRDRSYIIKWIMNSE